MIALSFVNVSLVLFAGYLLWQALNHSHKTHNLPLPPGVILFMCFIVEHGSLLYFLCYSVFLLIN